MTLFPQAWPRLLAFLLKDLKGSASMRTLWVFCVCLFLGIALISACAGLLQLVRGGLANQERALFGGDIEISDRTPVSRAQLDWLQANGTVSRLLELRTMLGTEDGRFNVVELQSVDDAYPLYGQMRLAPAQSLRQAVGQAGDGIWGAAFDPVLAEQLSLEVGDRVSIGALTLELRALILEQPDRSLRADWRGAPLIVDEAAVQASELLQPGSLVDYEYRVRTDQDPVAWRESLRAAFPDATWEVQSVAERGEFIGQRLDQVASVLLLLGCSTLLIGGLGVANSISAYLQSKTRTLATLQALGARQDQMIWVFIGQTLVLATLASAFGALCGAFVSLLGGQALAARLPVVTGWAPLVLPTLLAWLFGVLSALAFAMPGLGRTLSGSPTRLIRGESADDAPLPTGWRMATGVLLVASVAGLLAIVPDTLIALGFVLVVGLLLLLLEALVAGVRRVAMALGQSPWLGGHFALRMAVAGLHRPGTALRPMLLSLGTALTLLVACSMVIAATMTALDQTVPERAPALVFYDVATDQLAGFDESLSGLPGHESHALVPLVLGRLVEVNGERLSTSDNTRRALEANDEHKLSYRAPGIDNTTVDRGAWWPDDYRGPTLFAMEDREADQLGLHVGDQLTFDLPGQPLQAELAAIYSQARFETHFWLEGVFTPGALEPYITRYIGSAYFAAGTDVAAMSQLGEQYPNVVTVRTSGIIEAARALLRSASLGVGLVALVSLAASLLVMASVVAVNRQRQVFEASVLHAMGTRLGVVMQAVLFEYLLLGILLAIFAALVGSLLAVLILQVWIDLPVQGVWVTGLLVAVLASGLCLLAGAGWLLRTLQVAPAVLLRRAA